MKTKNIGPFQVKLSLRLLKDKFNELSKSEDHNIKQQAQWALELFKEHPKLVSGVNNIEDFDALKPVVDQLMLILFPPILSDNEIKGAVLPYSNQIFYCSTRMQKIMDEADSGGDIFYELYKDYNDSFDLMTYAIILNSYYDYKVDFGRPKAVSITDKNDVKKRYRVTFNGDFLDIYPNENAIEITDDILDELLANAYNQLVWEKYFPKDSWTVEGFGIINLIDISLDESIDQLKTHLIQPNKESFQFLNEDIKRIFNLPNLMIGSFRIENSEIIAAYDKQFQLLTVSSEERLELNQYACERIVTPLFKDNKPVVISNVELYHKQCGGNRLSQILLQNGLKSVALIPVKIKDELAFVMELATDKANELNAINMVKLDTIMPFILSYAERIMGEYENEISAVIQQECTSIHPSVHWRFVEEATKFIQERNYGDSPNFKEIVFKDVLALYGQVDVVGSSNARNEAIRLDLTKQLNISKQLLENQIQNKDYPFYEQLIFHIDKFLNELDTNFHTNSEQEVNLFFEKQLFPLFQYLVMDDRDSDNVQSFIESIDPLTKTLYEERKKYDVTIDKGNKELSNFLEMQQVKAQEMFPHYFEKFKTDGVEHNMYIGQSISQHLKFHPAALYNLRLWQLQVACEMEAMYYRKQKDFPLQLQVSSLILAYDVPLTIRYRMDEKQFDVDGAYNVLYEMIKKRIDKASIKGTNERLTQPHKLCVVYSSNAIEKEYLAYFEFLQSKNYIGETIEIVELEELQGASGIKAIRAEMNHNLEQVSEIFTVEDLQTI